MRAILIILSTILLHLSGQAASVVNENSSFQKANELACNGDFEGFSQEAKKVTPNDKMYVATQLNLLVAPNELKVALERINTSKKDIRDLSELERLLFASAIMRSAGPQDTSLIKKLLNFQSQNPTIEAYRKIHEAKLEYNSDPNKYFDELVQGFRLLPYVDGSVLHSTFAYGLRDKYPLLALRQFFPYIDQLPDNSPEKYLLLGDKNYLLSKVNHTEPDLSYYAKAYALCKYDFGTTLFYSNQLLHKKMNSEAKEVLLSLVAKFQDYPVYVDLLLARIYLQEKDFKNEKLYLDKANERKDVLTGEYQIELANLIADNEKQTKYSIWIGCAFLILLIIIFLCWYFRKRITHRNQKHPLS